MTRRHHRPMPPKEIPWTRCAHTGKMRFKSRKDAKRFAAMKSLTGLSAYQCTVCQGWHNGHLPKMVRDGDAVRWDMRPRVD